MSGRRMDDAEWEMEAMMPGCRCRDVMGRGVVGWMGVE